MAGMAVHTTEITQSRLSYILSIPIRHKKSVKRFQVAFHKIRGILL